MSFQMDKFQTECPALPSGWVREVVVRRSGASAGKSDIYYYSPDGRKCRSKPQIAQYLPDEFDIENFDFKTGRNLEGHNRKRRRRKDDFNFGKDFSMPNNHLKPRRHLKRGREEIEVTKLTSSEIEGREPVLSPSKRLTRTQLSDYEAKKRRSENLAQRVIKPRQLFWQRRLQGLKPVSEETMEVCGMAQLDDVIKDLLPGSNDQALLNSLMFSLFHNSKIVGQQMSQNALRKNPGVWVNPDQPFCAPFSITEEMVRAQERRVEEARKKLTEAQELLRALEDEEDNDTDDMIE